MIEVLALEVDLRTILLAESARVVEGTGATYIVTQQRVELLLEVLALDDLQVRILQLFDDGLKDGGDKGATEVAIKAVGIYLEGCHKVGILNEELELSRGLRQVTSFLRIRTHDKEACRESRQASIIC